MKLDRLLAVTMLLLNRKRVSAKELADRFEVSLRTVYRDLDTLNQAGIPIVSYAGAAGGYEIMESYRIDRQWLSLDELTALVAALKGMRSTQAIDPQSIDSLLDKVGALVARPDPGGLTGQEDELLIDLNPWQGGPAEREKFSLLRQAVKQRQVLRIAYTNAQGMPSERLIEPMGLVLKGYTWYVYAYCRERTDFRVFRLSRIKRAVAVEEWFERRAAPLSELDSSWQRRVDTKRIELVLHFRPKARVHAEDRFDEEAIESLPDGSCIVRVQYPDEEWLVGFVLGFGAGVRVVSPPHLIAAVREAARAIAAQYAEREP